MSTPRAMGNVKKRGHQHHPRNEGTRKRVALNTVTDTNLSEYSRNNVVTVQQQQEKPKITNENNVISNSAFHVSSSNSNKNVNDTQKIQNKVNNCDNEVIDLTNCDDEEIIVSSKELSEKETKIKLSKYVSKSSKEDSNHKARKHRKRSKSNRRSKETQSQLKQDMSMVFRPEAEGSSLSDQEFSEEPNLDPETEELSKLRCTSEMTEVVAEREKRRQRRCADYPGLAFASSIFSSDTLMKFSIIKNELHNIMNTQLKRVGIFVY